MYAQFNRPGPSAVDAGRAPGAATILFVALHVPLGLLMHEVSIVTVLHALLTVAFGCWVATTDPTPTRAAWAIAYVAGAEVLWRMTNDRVFWEAAKYSIILIAGASLIRMRRPGALVWPAWYFLLLLPSAVLTLRGLPFDEARNQLSFNLSGPLSLAMCAAFFGSLTLSREALQRLFLAAAAPVAGVAGITFYTIVTNPNIVFSHQSNFALSGGFGPNQVSAALGLGMLVAMLLVIERPKWPVLAAMGAAVVWFGAQSALTFSRGGVVCALSGAGVASLFYVRDRRSLVTIVGAAGIAMLIGSQVLWPRLDAFTGGNLSMRFQETDTSLRTDLGAEDLAAFAENPFMGLGPGLSKLAHMDDIISHTEFTRLLAEHGCFGAVVIALMVFAAVRNVWRGSTPREQALAAALMTWAFIFMSNSAMRLVAPSFTFGLAFASMGARRSGDAAPGAETQAAAPASWRLVGNS